MAITVRLNGGNYVSDKTRQAFEKALAEGATIKVAPTLAAPESARAAPVAAPAVAAPLPTPEPVREVLVAAPAVN